jgi:hypothetical protein
MWPFKRKQQNMDDTTNYVVDEEELTKSNLSFFKWVQEFSKRIVIITFIIFIAIDIVSLLTVILAYLQTGTLNYIDTIIAETNQTFRDVIGGYIIKAATENVSKGIGVIMDRYFAYKDKQAGVKLPNGFVSDDESSSSGDYNDILYNTSTDTIDDPQNPSDMNSDGEESDNVPIDNTTDTQ